MSKYLRANHASFVTRNFEKLLWKEQEISTYTKVAYNQQRNNCVGILKKSKRAYFESLDVKFVKDNKKF